ncbi:protein FAR1-RELATED SEQUENCE [Citrus sinensis]|nr:protein FAR1-RELATED SEQUENCE [Citrus sinensis]
MDNLEQVEEVDEVEELEDLQGVDLEGNNEELVPEKVVEPTVGMFFDSPDEMFEYYKAYGLQEGFPVMRRSCRKGDDGSLRYATFTCGRNGKLKAKDTNVLRLQPNQKIGCNAKLGGRLDLVTGKWVIGNMIFEHNHAVSPSKSSFKSVVVEAGGFEKVSFLEKDARNHIDKVRRLRLGEGDAVAIQRYFKKMQTENDGFFFSLDLDEEGRLKNVFWADPRSRAAYKDSGDVVTFDTTYLTNKYDMLFAPFVGVNHHGQSILLGCRLISHEDTETFTWLFDTWLSCMSGSPPLGIITDQDKAMKNAIEIVFPNTRHRWCLWHILKKVPEKLGRYVKYHAIRVSLHSVVYDSYTPVEFEEAWHDMLDKYDLINNQWLNGLYEERNRWVSCFVKNSFWARMSTTQRSESMNAFFDGYVNSKTTLKQFVEKYEKQWKVKLRKNGKRMLDTPSQCCHVIVYNYCLKNISYEDGGKMCGDSIVKSKSVMMHEIQALNISDIKRSALLFMMLPSYGGSGSYTENIQDAVVTRSKGRPPTQRKQKQFKMPKQKSNNASASTTVEVATTVPTQESHMALLAQQAPFEHAFSPPYYQSWMNYGGVHHENLQYFPQQNLEEANRGEFSSNEPST